MNAAAQSYSDGLVTNVPLGMSNATLDYAQKNPKDVAWFVQSAAKVVH